MRRSTLMLAVLMTLIAAAFPTVSILAQDAQPKVVLIEPIKNFDVVAKGEVLVHQFQMRNEGNATLELKDVRPACGCTVAKFDKTIAPGATGSVNVRLATESFAGPISKSIAVFTNDPESPKLQLVVKAKVRPYINVLPGFARYHYVQGEKIGVIPQTIWAEDGSDIKITAVKTPYAYVTANYREARPEERNPKVKGNQWHLEIKLAGDAPIGPLRQFIEVKIDHEKQKSVQIPLSGFVRPRQHVTPEDLDFGTVDGASLPVQRTVHFTNFTSDQIEVKEIDTGYEGLTAKVVPSSNQPGYRFKLMLTFGPELPKGDLEGEVKIHITDAQNPIIAVPIKGTIL